MPKNKFLMTKNQIFLCLGPKNVFVYTFSFHGSMKTMQPHELSDSADRAEVIQGPGSAPRVHLQPEPLASQSRRLDTDTNLT